MRSNTIRRALVGLLGHDSSILIGCAVRLRLMDQSQEILLGHAIFAIVANTEFTVVLHV